MKNLHLTINNFKDTPITTSQWHIRGEPERIAVRFGEKEYVTVLDNPVYFEIWNLDENGELKDLEKTIGENKMFPFRKFLENWSERSKSPEVELLEKISFWKHKWT